MEVIVLFSGGLDSLAALVYAKQKYGKENVRTLYCDLFHRYNEKESKASRKLAHKLGIPHTTDKTLDLGRFEREDAYIPHRNLYLLFRASQELNNKEEGVIVLQNTQIGETSVGDRTLQFNKVAEDLLNISHPQTKITVIAPFADKTKGEIVKWLLDNKVDLDLIKQTIGCFSPEPGNCGWCPSCFRRFIALEYNDIDTTGWFNKSPIMWEGVKEYTKKMLGGEYHPRRTKETIAVLEKYNIIKDGKAIGKINNLGRRTVGEKEELL